MHSSFLATLSVKILPHVSLSKSRLETLCLLIMGVISARTVNLSHLACERSSPVLIASTYRRLQRFFQHVILAEDWQALLIIRLLGLKGSWYLCLDRTNWKMGRKDVNLLVLAVVTQRLRVPLMWTVLSNGGNSSSEERIALMQRYLGLFSVETIRLLLADREFIGLKWLSFLSNANIPFVIRVRENLRITTDQGQRLDLRSFLKKCRGIRHFTAGFEENSEARSSTASASAPHNLTLHFAAKRIRGGELLILASNVKDQNILRAYRKRWAIECLFGDAKTRGLNLEDTRLLIARKLSLLFAIIAIAIAWVTKIAAIAIGRGTLQKKNHGYFAKSWFRTGFDEVRRAMRTGQKNVFQPWNCIRVV